ncbi:MAG: RNA polymerase sigma factor region1.1 domain-containing protein, partial [Alphaproteobacteria bacterium]
MATKAATTETVNETQTEAAEEPLIDVLSAAVKKLVGKGKERGYITYDELNEALPSEQVTSEQIEDVLAKLSEMGINFVEAEEAEEEPKEAEEAGEVEVRGGNIDDDDVGRTDDPVRMYLREMGSVELLSREGEIAIAKRIEAGRDKMIGAICESPLTIKAIIAWRDSLLKGELLLRDIIDLEGTYNGPIEDVSGQALAAAAAAAAAAKAGHKPQMPQPPQPLKVQPGKPVLVKPSKDGKAPGDDEEIEGPPPGEVEEEDPDEANLSLAAKEQSLMPDVVKTFDEIAATYKKLKKIQETRLVELAKGGKPHPRTEKRYQQIRDELVELLEGVRLNNGRIEQLVEQLYELNRLLMSLEGKLLRLATSTKVSREDFIQQYRGTELDPNWLKRVAKLATKGWKDFTNKYKDQITDIRQSINEVATAAELPIGEFRRIVSTVQAGEREASQAKKEMVEA